MGLSDLNEGVALCHRHGVFACQHSIYQALQTRRVGGLLGGRRAGLKWEVLSEAGSADMDIVFLQLAIHNLQQCHS